VQVLIVALYVDDGRNGPMPAPLRRNPLDDLIERMRREIQHGRDSTTKRIADGSKVAG
jgi:hypothetical protein